MTPYEYHLHLLSQTAPALRYDGSQPLEDWRQAARAKLRELLGLDNYVPCDLNIQAEAPEDMGAYTRMRFSFESEQGYRVPGWWLMPKAPAARPRDVMICLVGHGASMHLAIGVGKFPRDAQSLGSGHDYALQAVARGLCALTIEQRNFGECGGKPDGGSDCYMPSMTGYLLGRTTIGNRVWDVMRAVGCLDTLLPGAGKVFIMGNSGGGTVSWYATAMEPRIDAAMPSCSVCSYDGSIAPIHHCECNYVPGIRRWFDMGDLAGLIAPRPLLLVTGAQDRIFPIDAVRGTFRLVQSYYGAAGAADNCALHVGAEGHKFYMAAWEEFLRMA